MTFYESHEGSSRSTYIPGRDEAVDEVMREWEHRYSVYEDVTIFISTFNVNGKPPPSSFPTWLSYKGRAPDFYAIGLQEMDLSTQAFFYDVSSRQDEWIKSISRSLPQSAEYEMIEVVRLVGIMLVIFRRKDSPVKVDRSSVFSARLPTGIQLISRMGNKGGVAVSMQINNSSVCFVNSHMAAGNEELDKRNQDYREISQIRFPVTNKSIFNHDVIFWLGDLNYRLETPADMSLDVVRERCSSSETFPSMFAYDTLKQQQKLSQVFVNFHEPEVLKFRPSYKYDAGTSNWDSSEKCRCPAWCDRILWYTESSDRIVQTLYDSIDDVKLSDHKPVVAAFQLTVRIWDYVELQKVFEEATREADKRTNEALPQISLSTTEVDFGEVYFFESSVRTVTIKNVGKTKVSFKFTPHPDRQTISESWLSVTPPDSHVKVGSTCLLSLQVLVDKKVAWSVAGDGHLSEILVLRLDHGRDYFIPISARYKASVFGSSFVDLIRQEAKTPSSVCNLIDLDPSDRKEERIQLPSVPYAMYALVENLRKHGLEKIRFNDVSRHSEFIALRKALDAGTPENLFEVCKSPFNMFNTLLRLLDSFKDSIIPSSVQNECLRTNGDVVRCWECVLKFPTENRNVFEYYVEFARELISRNTDAYC
ncbi:unnamed protein product [Enterobius vermicularis]|uniref:IPPc domain-containing protein n=1 Tax=Enterobius vermicularis TaxID=51028 RepID=A0A0N4VIG1_ENTVE|nr:unnamed protein product [Enterobius vermicularis]